MNRLRPDRKIYQFSKNKYGSELLIDLIRLESLEKYIHQNPRHCLTYYDITFIQEGSGSFAIDEFEFSIKPNQLFFTAPGQIRQWKVTNIPYGLVLIFEEEFLCNFFNDSLFVKKLSFFSKGEVLPEQTLTIEQGDYLTKIMLQIEQEISAQKETHLLRALLYQTLAWLNNVYCTSHLFANKPLGIKSIPFGQLVEKYFYSSHAVSFYAGQLCITAGHLNDLVKKEIGISAKQYIINRLITEAKRLLLYSELPVSEIAWKLGFTDPSYFIRLFGDKTGVSPRAFRKDH